MGPVMLVQGPGSVKVVYRRLAIVLAVVVAGCSSDSGSGSGSGSGTGTGTGTGSEPGTGTGTSSGTGMQGCTELDDVLEAVGFEPACWEWVREDPSAWRTTPTALEIRSLPGTLWLGQNSTQNIALRDRPDAEAFTVDVHVVGELGNPAEQGGLLLYVDDDNYIKLVKERVGPQRAVVTVTETAAMPVVDGRIDIEADEAWLRIEATADAIVTSMRLAPQDPFVEVANTPRPTWWDDASVRVGLFTQAANAERWLAFDEVVVATQ